MLRLCKPDKELQGKCWLHAKISMNVVMVGVTVATHRHQCFKPYPRSDILEMGYGTRLKSGRNNDTLTCRNSMDMSYRSCSEE